MITILKTIHIKSFFQHLLIPDSFSNLSRIGKILTIAYLLSIQLLGFVLFSSIPYQAIHEHYDTVFQILITLFGYLLLLFSFFYLNTSFVEWILQIILGKFSTLRQFCQFLKSVFIFSVCFVGLMIALNTLNIIHPLVSCLCTTTTLDTIN